MRVLDEDDDGEFGRAAVAGEELFRITWDIGNPAAGGAWRTEQSLLGLLSMGCFSSIESTVAPRKARARAGRRRVR